MVDVGHKPLSPRCATAEALVPVGDALHDLIAEQRHKKGDVLTIAQLAGISAVKHTATLIPLCHPLPIDGVDLTVTLEPQKVRITATVRTTWKTGVEMEALHAAATAALTIIDMGKAVQRGLGIESVRLLEKIGGTYGDYHADKCDARPASPDQQPTKTPVFRCAVLTVSDRAATGRYEDLGGPTVRSWLTQTLHSDVIDHAIVPDDLQAIREHLLRWAQVTPTVDAIFSTGGTGLSPRDVTPEATLAVIDRRYEGLMELVRHRCGQQHVKAYLSRGVAGIAKQTLIVNLPGSPSGAVEVLDAMRDVLPHALRTMRGEKGACPA
jgi:cyclic pyranopterin phosphate synthase